MAGIPDTEYVTIKRGRGGMVDVLVGGKPATTYRNQKINCERGLIERAFESHREQSPNILEVHVLSSETLGEFAMVGNPSSTHGSNAWCRVKNNDGELGGWVFCNKFISASGCARGCVYDYAYYILHSDVFQRALLEAFDNYPLSCIDWPKYLGVHKFGPYEIFVRKISPNTK